MESRVTNLETRMTRLEHIVVGNGKPGLDEVIREHAKQLVTLEKSLATATAKLDGNMTIVTQKLDGLIGVQKTKDAEEAGRQKLLRQIRGLAIALLTMLGGGGWYVVDALRALGAG